MLNQEDPPVSFTPTISSKILKDTIASGNFPRFKTGKDKMQSRQKLTKKADVGKKSERNFVVAETAENIFKID